MLTQRPRGTFDLGAPEIARWQYVENYIRDLCRRCGYDEVRTPIIEHTELFERGVGEATDVVEKEMYTFLDRGDRSLTLRPEGTAPVLRAYLENGWHNRPKPVKMYYLTAPMFRFERPQAGRYRQHFQFGVESLGSPGPEIDAEIISLPLMLLEGLGLENLAVRINSMGCTGCRPDFREALLAYYRPRAENLCSDCRRRLEMNPLRLLDCKSAGCTGLKAGAPRTVDHLCGACRDHFHGLQKFLVHLGVNFTVDHSIVRGFDYYERTVFEITDTLLGAQSSVVGGGRYDGLVEVLGGEPTPGIGFGMGMERLMGVLENHGVSLPEPPPVDVYVAAIGPAARARALSIVHSLRKEGRSADMDYMDRGLRAQMRQAGRYPARHVLIIGEDELASGRAPLRAMATGEQIEIDLNDISSLSGRLA